MRWMLVATLVTCLSAAGALAAQPNDIFATLGLSPEDAHANVLASLTSGTIALRGRATPFKEASSDGRASMVRAVMAAARSYFATTDFAGRYSEWRESMRPVREQMPQTGDEGMAAQQKAVERAIDEAQKMSADLPPDARKQLTENIEEMKKQLAALYADPSHRQTLDATIKEAARAADADFAEREAEFELAYPADPQRLVAKRLREFLALSATVDFSAKLVERDKRMRFADPALEAKPPDWKLLYRAGKPAVDAARAAAEEWLNTLAQ